jgi:hypothetical protein
MSKKQTLQYIINCGGNATRATLREDYEPIGDKLWAEVLEAGYAREDVAGGLELTEAGRAFLAAT